ncbi:MAG: acyltransferase [Chryseolinea sp.]
MIRSPKLEYVESFDGLRGFAVLMVVMCHGSYGLFPGGFLGVDLFFVISGYLITGMLWSECAATGTISRKNFYARRLLRLYPALLIAVVIALALWRYTNIWKAGDPFIAAFSSFFYLANIVDDEVMGNMNPFWSLSVEEHFYLIWPLIILAVLSGLASAQRVSFITLLIIGTTLFRIMAGYHGEWHYGRIVIDPYSFTLCRIDCILIGALMYFSIQCGSLSLISGNKKLHQLLLTFSMLAFVSFGFMINWSDSFWLKGGFLLTNAVSAIVVFEALRNSDSPIFSNKAITWIGQRSYGIYVYHYPIFLVLEHLRRPHDPLNFVLVSFLRIILSIAIAGLSYKFIERPALRYKKKFPMSLAGT